MGITKDQNGGRFGITYMVQRVAEQAVEQRAQAACAGAAAQCCSCYDAVSSLHDMGPFSDGQRAVCSPLFCKPERSSSRLMITGFAGFKRKGRLCGAVPRS